MNSINTTGLTVSLIAILGLGLFLKLTGSWPFLDLGAEVVPVEQEHPWGHRELTPAEKRVIEEQARRAEAKRQAFIAKRDQTWARAKAEWKKATQDDESQACPIQVEPEARYAYAAVSGPEYETSSLQAGSKEIQETLRWHLESIVHEDGSEKLGVAVEIMRSPRPLMLELVHCRLGTLLLEAPTPPVTRYRTTTPIVLERYHIPLTRTQLEKLSQEDTVFTLRGENRVKRKLLLPARDCIWMLKFSDYQ